MFPDIFGISKAEKSDGTPCAQPEVPEGVFLPVRRFHGALFSTEPALIYRWGSAQGRCPWSWGGSGRQSAQMCSAAIDPPSIKDESQIPVCSDSGKLKTHCKEYPDVPMTGRMAGRRGAAEENRQSRRGAAEGYRLPDNPDRSRCKTVSVHNQFLSVLQTQRFTTTDVLL